MTPVQAIRKKCVECSGGKVSEVRSCQVVTCALHLFRLGTNPNREGIGNKKFTDSSGHFRKHNDKSVLRVVFA